MRRLFVICLFILINIVSFCSCTKDEWDDDSEPVGIMYLDGIELRETGNSGLFGHLDYYGYLILLHNKQDLYYAPYKFTNKSKSIRVLMTIETRNKAITKEQLDEGHWHYNRSMGDEAFEDFYFVVKGFMLYEEFGISSLDVRFSEIDNRYEGERDRYECRIDYQMELIDPLGRTRSVKGWAIPSRERGEK